jgi:type 1 glutamine amidotransferase
MQRLCLMPRHCLMPRLCCASLVLAAVACSSARSQAQAPSSPSTGLSSIPPAFSVLVFSRTQGFRHDSIPAGIAAIRLLGQQRGFSVDATEESEVFADAVLAKYQVVVFLLTTGNVLGEAQKAAFERFVRAGGGFVGVHSAADTEYDWPFYGALLGAYFAGHPDIQTATVQVENPGNPSTSGLPRLWVRKDEWYNFQRNPRGSVDVLATLDERTYAGGTMAADHPIIWSHTYEGGRAWYTAGGHTPESYSEPLFVDHLGKAILWAAGQL